MMRIPPENLRFMRETEEQFVSMGDEMVGRIGALMPLGQCRRVVDIGCGYGRIGAAFRRSTEFHGTYEGFDILPVHIKWCRRNLGSRRFRYRHIDIYSERYNPNGRVRQTDVRFPVPSASADLVVLTSVFTHMYPDDVVHYLQECRRIVAASGRVYATFLVMNEQQAARPNSYPLPHELTPFCRYMSAEEPLHAIAYSEEWLRRRFEDAGLRIDGDFRPGTWSGEADAFDWQDTVLLEPVPGSLETPTSQNGRVDRRFGRRVR